MTRPLLLGFALLALGCATGANARRPPPPDPLDTVSADELFSRGVRLGQAGDFIRAEQYIAAAIERGYSEERAMPALMAACVQGSRLSAALGYAEPYLARHPNEWSLRLLVASIHMGLSQHERARDELARVLRDAPEEPPQAHYFLGVLHRDHLDDADIAHQRFRRYLELAPDGPHRDEAISALPDAERAAYGVPTRVPAEGGAGVPVRMPPHEPSEPGEPASDEAPSAEGDASP
jgi:tetratricopeptide (TPR) repeat protein